MLVTKAQYEKALRGEIVLMTPDGRAALFARLNSLRDELLELEGQLGYAAQDYPDLRENAIYGDLAMKIQLDLPRQADDVREMLANAFVVEAAPKAQIGIGTRFAGELSGAEVSFTMVGPAEVSYLPSSELSNPVSYLSPIGRAVWGAKAGDVRKFSIGDYDRSVTILSLG